MDQIVTLDCPECHGAGDVPFDEDMDAHDQMIHRRHCGTCLKRWDDANPLPKRPTAAELQQAIADVRGHIERRIAYYRAKPATDFDHYAYRLAASELTEILALLDRVLEGGGK